jgi:hypothetical protein
MKIQVTFHSLSDSVRFIKQNKISDSEILANEGISLTLPLYLLCNAEESDLVASVEEISCSVGGDRLVCSNEVFA